MPKAHFLLPDGTRQTLEIDNGTSLMRAATAAGITGIVGDCGGVLACATCHVFVDDAFTDRLPSRSANEEEMLDYTAAPRAENSRLSCQLAMTDELDGIVVTVADPQL